MFFENIECLCALRVQNQYENIVSFMRLTPKKRLNDVQYALTAATQCLQCKIYRLIIHSVSVVLFILSKQFKLCKIEDNTTLG